MKRILIVGTLLTLAASAQAADLTVAMKSITPGGVGAEVGTVSITQTPYGLVFSPKLTGLPPGLHGFHVHENPSCDPKEKDGKMVAGLAAGDHLDPKGAKHHGAPWGDGDLGDLPALYVGGDGTATNAVLAPRLHLADVENRSLVIHVGGDNYSDHPAPNGGGGARMVCGVIGS